MTERQKIAQALLAVADILENQEKQAQEAQRTQQEAERYMAQLAGALPPDHARKMAFAATRLDPETRATLLELAQKAAQASVHDEWGVPGKPEEAPLNAYDNFARFFGGAA